MREPMGQISLDSCDRMRELFSASLDGELAELDEARVQAHLAGCGACRAYADTAAAASRLVRAAPLEQPSFPIVVPGRASSHHATQSAKLRFPDQELRMLRSASHAPSRPRFAL